MKEEGEEKEENKEESEEKEEKVKEKEESEEKEENKEEVEEVKEKEEPEEEKKEESEEQESNEQEKEVEEKTVDSTDTKEDDSEVDERDKAADDERDDEDMPETTLTGPPPSLSFSVSSIGPFSVTLFVQVNMSSYVWCTAKRAVEELPWLMEILGYSQHYFASTGNWEISGLTKDTKYHAYCYAESEQGVGMTAPIANLGQPFTTEDGKCGGQS